MTLRERLTDDVHRARSAPDEPDRRSAAQLPGRGTARLAADAARSSPATRSRAPRCCRCCTWCSPRRATSPRPASRFCAEQLDLTTAEVTAVATFYSMYRRTPTGEYLVGVCTNTLCAVMGGDAIFDELKDHLGVGHDETTEDGKVTLEHVECNAACDYAPVVMVNWEFFDNQTP